MASLFHTSIRVFLSSTFRDMQHERDYLVKQVFPQIERRCAQQGIVFEVIDLRWGVTGDSTPAEVIGHCMRQIEGCVPYLLGLLGHRYGWIPSEQPASAAALQPGEAGLSVTEIELQRFEQGVARANGIKHALVGLRSAALTAAFNAGGQFDAEPPASAAAMDQLRRAYGPPHADAFEYDTLEQLKSQVESYFLEQARQLAGAVAAPLAWLDARQTEYLRLLALAGVEHIAPALHVRQPDGGWQALAGAPLAPGQVNILYGAPGSGKTAWCAELARRLRASGAAVLCLHVGASGATSVTAVIRDLCHLAGLPDGDAEWSTALPQALSRLGNAVLILDGVERLSDWDGAPRPGYFIDSSVSAQLLALLGCLLGADQPPALLLSLDPQAGPANALAEALRRGQFDIGWQASVAFHVMRIAPLDPARRAQFAHAFFRHRGKDLTAGQLDLIVASPLRHFDSLQLACHRLQQFGGLCPDPHGQDAFILQETARLFSQPWEEAIGAVIDEARLARGVDGAGVRGAILALLVAYYGLPATALVALVRRVAPGFTLRDWAVVEGMLGPLLVRGGTRFSFKNAQVAASVAALFPAAGAEMNLLRQLLADQLIEQNRQLGLLGVIEPKADRIFPAELPRQLALLPGHPGWRQLLQPVQLASWFADDRHAAAWIFEQCYRADAFQQAFSDNADVADPQQLLREFRQQARTLLTSADDADRQRYRAAFDNAELVQSLVELSSSGDARIATLTSAYAFRCAIADDDASADNLSAVYEYGKAIVCAVAARHGPQAGRASAWLAQTEDWYRRALEAAAADAAALPEFIGERARERLNASYQALRRQLGVAA